mmetsp:Transcript_28836/g.82800  ORF Transcript_28836/g.82800 Transcript_28836/m.82800 type:complete len:120 (-) Transcript_28836:173-532(-)
MHSKYFSDLIIIAMFSSLRACISSILADMSGSRHDHCGDACDSIRALRPPEAAVVTVDIGLYVPRGEENASGDDLSRFPGCHRGDNELYCSGDSAGEGHRDLDKSPERLGDDGLDVEKC